jgi:hypothetical protein
MQHGRIIRDLIGTARHQGLVAVACLGLCASAGLADPVNFGGKVNFGGGSTSTADVPPETNASPATQLHAARARLKQVRLSHWSELKDKGEYQSARDQLVAARNRLDTARQATLHDLRQSVEYRRLHAALSEKEKQFEKLRADPDVEPQQRFQAATQLLQFRVALTKAEASACAAEPQIADAKQSLVEAYATIARLQDEQAASLRNDPQWHEARQQLASARQRAYHASPAPRQSAATTSQGARRVFNVGVIGSRHLALHWNR